MSKTTFIAKKVEILYAQVRVNYNKEYRVYPDGLVYAVHMDDEGEYERSCYPDEVYCGITYDMIQQKGLEMLK